MDCKLDKNWYLTKPEAISRYLVSFFRNWDCPVFWNRSNDSESVYIKVQTGTSESPKTLHIRISDHSIPPEDLRVVFDHDVYSNYEREGAINYIKLLSKLAEELGKHLPAFFGLIKPGTHPYKNYRIEMQHRKKLAGNRRHFFREERLYV